MRNEESGLGQTIMKAFFYFANLLAFLFTCPWAFWLKATRRLSKLHEAHSISAFIGNESPWPFFSFIKKILYDCVFDGVIFIGYFVGVLYSIVNMVIYFEGGFWNGILAFFATLLVTYFAPLWISCVRDVFTVVIVLPFRKVVSWLYKPAQHLDLVVKKSEEK